MARDTKQTERCPVCADLTTFDTMRGKPCDSCEVPLLAVVPFQRPLESRHGYRLTIAKEAKEILRVAYSSKANLPESIGTARVLPPRKLAEALNEETR